MADRTETHEAPAHSASPQPARRPPREEEQEDRGFLREHPIKSAIGFLVLIGLGVGAFLYWSYSQTYENTDDAFVDGHINYISPRIAGTITSVFVQENQTVETGQVLAEIDPADYQVAFKQAQAGLAQSQAQIRFSDPGVPITNNSNQAAITETEADIANAEAAIASAERDHDADLARLLAAEADSTKAQTDLVRYKALVAKEEVSQQEYDQKLATAQSSAAQVKAIQAQADAAARIVDQRKAALAQVTTKLQELKNNAPQQLEIRRAAVQQAQANAQASNATVDQALLNLKYTKILAPVSGIIGRKAVEVGMRVQPGQQLLVIIPLDDIWVTANFKENQIRRMRPQQRVKIHVDAFDKDYEGYLESLPATTGAKLSILPPENATGNYVKVVQRLPVRIRFKEGQDPERRLRPGMSVEPKVFW